METQFCYIISSGRTHEYTIADRNKFLMDSLPALKANTKYLGEGYIIEKGKKLKEKYHFWIYEKKEFNPKNN